MIGRKGKLGLLDFNKTLAKSMDEYLDEYLLTGGVFCVLLKNVCFYY